MKEGLPLRESSRRTDTNWRVRTHKARSYLTTSNRDLRFRRPLVTMNVINGEDGEPELDSGKSLKGFGTLN